jgi:hypothetical protein
MEFIEPDAAYSPSLSVGQDNGFANELSLGLIKFNEDCERPRLRVSHGLDFDRIGTANQSQKNARNLRQQLGNLARSAADRR